MSHFLLMLACILSIEVFIRFNFLLLLESILGLTKKVTFVVLSKNISDYWKEKVIPAYALRLMKLSLQILMILFCIICFFIAADIFLSDFLLFALSFIGIIESVFFGFGYVVLRKLIMK
jgi:hypothetical protein